MDSDIRPNKDARVMIELDLISEFSTCQRGRVASALVNTDRVILVPSRNGTPYGIKSCKDQGLDITKRCYVCIHSERNCLNHAARLGICTKNQSLFTLVRPCINCANDIIQAGINEVFYRNEYMSDDYSYVENLFLEKQIKFIQLPMTKDEVSFHNMLTAWRKAWI